jgi:hypothetical protein
MTILTTMNRSLITVKSKINKEKHSKNKFGIKTRRMKMISIAINKVTTKEICFHARMRKVL